MLLYIMLAYLMLLYLMLFVLKEFFFAIDSANVFCFHALSWFIDTVCLPQILFSIMHSAFNLLVFPNSMYTPFFEFCVR